MNFKTTIALLVAVMAVGLVIFINRDKGGKKADVLADKLIKTEARDVSKILIVAQDGKETALENTKGQWHLTRPVQADAELAEVDSLVNTIVELKSRSQVDMAGDNAKAMGLDRPQFQVELWAGEKHWKLAVGEKSAVGDNLYVRLDDENKAQLVATDLLDKLDRPASALRKTRLIETASTNVRQLSITRNEGKLILQKDKGNWRIIQPIQAAAENSAVDDMVMAVTSLQAVDFASEGAESEKNYQLDRPQMTVYFSESAPTTQPSTQPAGVIVKFGRYDDVLKKNVYAKVDGSPAIAKVPASIIESLNKTALDLRDKQVENIDSEKVNAISLTIENPPKMLPATRPAPSRQISISRRNNPTTSPATAPAEKPSKWIVTSLPASDADDANVDALLADFQPIRAEKFLEQVKPSATADRYVLQITTQGPGGTPVNHYQFIFTDNNDGQNGMGQYNGLLFEVGRPVLEHLKARFARSK